MTPLKVHDQYKIHEYKSDSLYVYTEIISLLYKFTSWPILVQGCKMKVK